MARGRIDEANEVLALLEGAPIDSQVVRMESDIIRAAIEAESAGGPIQWREYFGGGKKQTFRRLILAYGIQMMQQLTGINAVIFYSSYLLQNVLGLDRHLSLIVGGCTGLSFFVFTFIPIIFIDRWGRRKPLMLGAAGQAISMLVIAILVKLAGEGNKKAGAAGVVFVMIYVSLISKH